MSLAEKVEEELEEIYEEEHSLKARYNEIEHKFIENMNFLGSSSEPLENRDELTAEQAEIEEELENYEPKEEHHSRYITNRPNDQEAVERLLEASEAEGYDEDALQQIGEGLNQYFSNLPSEISGELAQQHKTRIISTAFHQLSAFDADKGQKISPISLTDSYREKLEGELRDKLGPAYETFKESVDNFEGILFGTEEVTKEESAPLIEVAYKSTNNDYGLDNLGWWNPPHSTENEREAVRESKEAVNNWFKQKTSEDTDHLYTFRGVNLPPEKLSDKRPPLEFTTLNPVFAYEWAENQAGEEASLIVEETPIENTWAWSNFSTERYPTESAVLVEREVNEDYEAEKVQNVNLFEYAMKSALRFKDTSGI